MRFWGCAGFLILLLAGVQITSMLGETQTWDEGIHVIAGYSYLTTGDYRMNPEHPALGKMLCALPLLALHPKFDRAWWNEKPVDAGVNFVYLNRISPDVILNTARAVTIALTLLFASFVAWWTRRHYGDAAALIALAFFCFDPNIIAHGRYVTTDLIVSLFIFAACALWIDALAAPGWTRTTLAGIALGLALTSKYSALFLVPVLVAAGLWRRRPRATAGLLAAAAAVVFLVYAPDGGRSYWEGLHLVYEHNAGGHPSYLLGQFSQSGWWYYFPVAFLVKTPVATLLAAAAAAFLFARRAQRPRVEVLLAVVPPVFLILCMTAHIDIGLRHLLPVYAFLFVLIGRALAKTPRLAIALVLLLAIESLSIYPHYLAFFNRLAGGPRNGPHYLLDSNIDWGQDVKKLGAYMAQNKIESICLSFFGHVHLMRYGVNYVDFPANPADADCIAAVSVTPLYGLYVGPERFAWLRRQEPIARIGYSIYVYDLRKRH